MLAGRRMPVMSDFQAGRRQFEGHLGSSRVGSHSTQPRPLACHETANIPSRAKLHAHGSPLLYLHPRHLSNTYSIVRIRTQTCLLQELMVEQRVSIAQNHATRLNQCFEWMVAARHWWTIYPEATRRSWRTQSRGQVPREYPSLQRH